MMNGHRDRRLYGDARTKAERPSANILTNGLTGLPWREDLTRRAYFAAATAVMTGEPCGYTETFFWSFVRHSYFTTPSMSEKSV
jgi:hypothetical protein